MVDVLKADHRHRYIVFTASRRRALNLGARQMHARAPVNFGADGEAGAEASAFLIWLFRQAGLNARDYRPASLLRRLPACLRALRVTSIPQARRLLRGSPHLVCIALDALLLGVTEFFRDAHVFACLRNELSLIASRKQAMMRIWSAGCSNGAELYSVAALLDELNLLDRCELLGTDCRADAIARAAAAGERVACGQRERTTWRGANVLAGVEPGPWDVILCRNLAMYLQPDSGKRLWRGLASVLNSHGVLVVGKAERPAGVNGLTPLGPCVYRR
jgi:chemotaxis protein methyltransferase CheR